MTEGADRTGNPEFRSSFRDRLAEGTVAQAAISFRPAGGRVWSI